MRSLSSYATRVMVMGLLVVLAAQAAVLNHSNSSTIRSLADDKIRILLSTQAANLSAPFWNYELDQVRNQIQAALQESMVVGIRVVEENQSGTRPLAAAGVAYGTPGYEAISAPVVHADADGGKERTLGHVDFLVDYAPVRAQVLRLTLLTIFTSLVAFGIVAATMQLVLNHAISPVTTLSRLMSRADAVNIPAGEIGAIRASTLEVANLIVALQSMQSSYALYQNELLREKEIAEGANRAKSDFLANMSHELRTPLNSIIGLVELMSDTKLPQEALDSLAVVELSSKNLLHIVNDILDLSKIESSKLEMEMIPFSPVKCLFGAMQMLRPQASARGTMLAAHIEMPEELGVLGDPKRFSQILINLVGNAVKYTDRGRVTLDARVRNLEDGRKEVIVDVIDTGIGIEKEKLEHIFEKFVQADGSITRKYGGTGLGLTITRQLTQLMGGEISVQSTVGVGSRFTVRISFSEALLDESAGAAEEAVAVSDGAIPADQVRVLVAEDHQLNQIFMRKLLTTVGVSNFRIVDNGRDVVDAVARGEVDIVLMDCHMPVMSGYEASQAIRRAEKAAGADRHVPIVAMTANALVGERENCIAHGMDEYISKPVDRAHMIRLLSRWIRFPEKVSRKNLGPLRQNQGQPPASAALAALNPEVLDSSSLGDEDMKKEMAALFISQSAPKLAELEKECTDGINVAWKEKVHFLKGGAATMGAERMRQLCEDAQGMINSTAEHRRNMRARIIAAYDAALEELGKMKLTG